MVFPSVSITIEHTNPWIILHVAIVSTCTSRFIVGIARSVLGSVDTSLVFHACREGPWPWPWPMYMYCVHVSQIRNTCVHYLHAWLWSLCLLVGNIPATSIYLRVIL